jgi:hypothetical protein
MMTDAQYIKHICKVFGLYLLKKPTKEDSHTVYDISTGKSIIVAEGMNYKELREALNKWGLNR